MPEFNSCNKQAEYELWSSASSTAIRYLGHVKNIDNIDQIYKHFLK